MHRYRYYAPLQALIRQHRLRLAGIYVLNGLVALLSLCVAPAAGMMIDSLINRRGWGVTAFVLTYIGWQGLSTWLRILDTQVFSLLFNQLCLELLAQQRLLPEPIPSTRLNARIELLKQVVAFLEDDFPFMLSSVVSIVGACLLLYLYNWKLVIVSFVVLVPSIWINQRYARKLQSATKAINDQYEQQVDVVNSANAMRQQAYFSVLRLLSVRKSTLEATNFALLEIFVFIMIVASIYLICRTDGIGYGQVIGSYGLILRFAYGFDFIPHLTTKLASLRDVLHRIQSPVSAQP